MANAENALIDAPSKAERLLDALAALLIFAAVVIYLPFLPHNLGQSDESIYLYEAKRLLEGAVLYRDLFEIITPGWMYFMAFLFWLFGTDLTTARIGMAVVHGVTAVVIYLTCRRLGVRRALSWPASLAYLVVSQPAWPVASQHWLGTCLCVVLLWICAARRRERATWPLLPGLVIGLLIGVHQQRGAIMAFGIFVWLIADHLVQRRYQPSAPSASLVVQLTSLVAGSLAVVAPLCLGMIASAGFENVWRALLIHPIFNYSSTYHCEWGHINVMTAAIGSFTFPRLLKYLPVILVVCLLRLVALLLRRRGQEEVGRLALLIFFCLSSMVSIAYFPDFIHIAFIAPAFFVTVAESAEWAVRRIAVPSRVAWVVGPLAAAGLLIASGFRLHDNMMRSRAIYRHTRWTAFGRVDLANEKEMLLYDKVNELMRDAPPPRELYCYPLEVHLYLMLDARNPTPYGYFLPWYNSPDQVREVREILEAKKLPYLVVLPGFLKPDDPIMEYIRRDYAPLTEAGEIGQAIYRRKDLARRGLEERG